MIVDPGDSQDLIRIHPMMTPTYAVESILGTVLIFEPVIMWLQIVSSIDSDQGPLSRDHVQLLSLEIARFN
jgi:hypothetical protein